jgi:hypothetical protein
MDLEENVFAADIIYRSSSELLVIVGCVKKMDLVSYV